jgi:putative PEP-CTERM system TPR-repeat lipoprotein
VLACVGLTACGARDPQQWSARADESLAAGEYRAALIDLRNLIRHEPQNPSHRFRYAQALSGLGDFAGTAAELRKAREFGAPDAELVPLLVDALVASGQFAEALREVEHFAAAGGYAGSLARGHGQALLGLGRTAEAKEHLEQALERDPKDVTARVALAAVQAALAGAGAGKAELDAALAQAPRDFDVRYARGYWYARALQFREARAEFAAALSAAREKQRADREAVALVALIESDLALGDVESATAQLAALEKSYAGSVAALLMTGRVATRLGDYDRAETALLALLSRHPDNRRAKLLLGGVAFAKGDLARSEMYLASAARGAEDDAASVLLAEVRLRQNKARDVVASVQAAGAHAGGDLLATAGRASVLLGDLEGAVAYFERGRAAAPQNRERALDLASAYLATGRVQDALAILEPPPAGGSVEYRRELLLASALVAAGRRDDARREAQRLARERPQDERALLLAARSLLGAGDADGARAMVVRITRLRPGDAAGWLALGWLEWAQRDVAAAGRAFDEALRRDAGNIDAAVGKAAVVAASGDVVDAVRRLDVVRQKSKDALRPRLALVSLHLAADDRLAAARVLAEAKAIAPHALQVRLLDGATALASGRFGAAIEIHEKIVEDFPGHAALRGDLARAYLAGGRMADAARAAEAALRIDASYWPANAIVAAAATQTGDFARAQKAIAQLRSLQAPAALLTGLEGDLAMRRGAYDRAAQLYAAASEAAPSRDLALREHQALRAAKSGDSQAPLRRWLDRAPDDAPVRLQLAQAAREAGNSGDAIAHYREALRARPNDATALNNLAWLLLEQGEHAESLALAKRAYGLAAGRPEIADTYGWTLLRNGRAGEAVPILRQAHEKAEANADIRYHLAAALAAIGEVREAREHLELLVATRARFEGAADARSLLDRLPPDGATGAT